MRYFVVGDVHGHVDLLQELLLKAGAVDREVTIVQVGDLGNFSRSWSAGDAAAYKMAIDLGIVVLWGNHDAAVFDGFHSFNGYQKPTEGTVDLINMVKPRYAFAANGYLITHAGLHPLLAQSFTGCTASEIAHEINRAPLLYSRHISHSRGGPSLFGGILWRDAREPLYQGCRQIFGHTSGYVRKIGDSYCIDAESKHGNLAGIWLDTQKVVAVGPAANVNEISGNYEAEDK